MRARGAKEGLLRAVRALAMTVTVAGWAIEDFGMWCFDRLFRYLAHAVVVAGILCVGVQIGLHKGRLLEREAIAAESAALGAAIVGLEAEVERLRVEKLVADIIECESGGRHDGVWGDGGESYGVAQFKRPTFEDLKAKAGLPRLRWKDRDDQITLLKWAVANGHGRLWTCYQESPLTLALSRKGQG